VSHSYDHNFHQTGLQVNSTSPFSFGYDEDGLMTAAGSMTLTPRADNGLLQSTTLGSISDSWTYNLFGEPARYTASYNSTPVFAVEYVGRDHLGRLTHKRESIEGGTAVDTTTATTPPAGCGACAPTAAAAPPVQVPLRCQRQPHRRLHAHTGDGTSTYLYDALGNLRHVTLLDNRLSE
jgi:YD repeat-containing protein